ncbi:galactose mutarotase-like domain-containing protein [Tuber borchii]|uniref:Glucose-6-phosphate 1-epimerase n=1 Tax=Tuber borchii TaxID=42251 RepID=A0A2T6ZE14_TUBBO|nr:galactose mutarotase-like domain-containing protein [Tuber borchii]
MVERSKKPGPIPVSSTEPESPGFVFKSDRVKLSLPTGESAEILLHGATVISWVAGGGENLFLSEKAALDGSKPVRGGIPLVFPVFGKSTEGPTAALPQHGFARICKWELLGRTSETDTSIQVDFGLGPENLTVEQRKQWPYDFGLIYSVNLSKSSLETKMLVRNEGSETFDFNFLFHTYLRIPDVNNLTIEGLKGTSYKCKVTKSEAVEEMVELSVGSEVDRVYANVPDTVQVKNGGEAIFKVDRTNLEDVVVWNPWEGASKMADFGPEDGYKNMICIEAGAVSKWHTLEPQSVWEGSTIINL